MDNSSYVTLSLSTAMRRSMDITTNNIANMNTAGFKGEKAKFENYLHKQNGDKGTVDFVIDGPSYMDKKQGGLAPTGNNLDVALQGQGWMAYENTQGRLLFGRDGRLVIDNQGNLTTTAGNSVLDAGGAPIAIPPNSGEIVITKDGLISDAEGNQIASIGVFNVEDINAYERLGGGMFGVPDGLQQPQLLPDQNTQVVQGFIEQSNVNGILEMTRMMEVQRAYERSVKLSDYHNDLRKNLLQRMARS